jgi:predicted phosphodiesterase
VIVVLSDLHLGLAGAPAPESLLPALDGATELILNGDAAESASARVGARAASELARLEEAVRSRGIGWVRIEGNHDPGTGSLHAWRADGAVLVTHGHAFHPTIAPFGRHARAAAQAFADAHAAGAGTPEPLRTLEAARAASRLERSLEQASGTLATIADMARRPWSFPQVIGWWRICPELAARFLESTAPGAAAEGRRAPLAIVSGHSHSPGAWHVRGTLVLNTGSFSFPVRPHAVRIDSASVSIAPLRRVRGEWRQDEAGRRTWRIDELARAAAARSMPQA